MLRVLYVQRRRYILEQYLKRLQKYGLTCAPMITKMPRTRFLFTPEGWVRDVRFFPRGEPEGESEGELCFAAIEKRTLAACDSYDRCLSPSTLSHEQKVDFYHLLMLKPFEVGRRESSDSLTTPYAERYMYYVYFFLGLLHYLTQKALVRPLDVFFVHKMLPEFINPMNWMRGIEPSPLEFDMFGDVITEPDYAISYVDNQCRSLGVLLSGFYDFVLLNLLDEGVPCVACKLFRGFDVTVSDAPECSQLCFLKKKLVK